MPLSESDLISRFFSRCGAQRADVVLGVGDDGAVLECPPGSQLVAVLDSLVEEVHFPAGSPARSIGHRALAVNLSDLAAMGAQPAWALLALALPAADEAWLTAFSAGLDALARQHGVALVGGDTTGGKLCISVQMLGFVPRGARTDPRRWPTGRCGFRQWQLRRRGGRTHAGAVAADAS